jgi:hypothetical protein
MHYFTIRAAPKPGTEQARDSGGAYVSCWVNFKIRDGAELLAKHYVEQAGWVTEEVEEAKWVERDDYENDSENSQYFTEAEDDGASFVFHSWDINDKDNAD